MPIKTLDNLMSLQIIFIVLVKFCVSQLFSRKLYSALTVLTNKTESTNF